MPDFRRHDDDPLYERISRLENHVSALENKVNTLSLEQKHMLDLFAARFSTMERSQELTISEVRALNSTITTMAAEPDKSPAGRAILTALSEFKDGAKERTRAIDDFREWKQNVDGAVKLLKFVGFSALGSAVSALVWVWLRTLGKVP